MLSTAFSSLQRIAADTSTVAFAALAIVGLAVLVYCVWLRPGVRDARKSLDALIRAAKRSQTWEDLRQQAAPLVAKDRHLQPAWREIERRVVRLPSAAHPVPATFGLPVDVWNVRQLVSPRINLALAEAIPNILVGIGLLFTFAFLTLALTQATSALTAQATENSNLLEATRGLLGAAGSKFLTSLAGLFASVAWTLALRGALRRVETRVDAFLDEFSRIVPTNAGELAAVAQLLDSDQQRRLASQSVKLVESLRDLNQDSAGLLEQLHNASEEQLGVLKFFKQDLALAIGKAVSSSLSPALQSMSERLAQAVENLSDRLGAMNQEALRTMVDDFTRHLGDNTRSEMEQLRTVLDALVSRLDGAGEALGKGAEATSQSVESLTATINGSVASLSRELTAGTERLQTAFGAFDHSAGKFNAALDRAHELGQQSATLGQRALDSGTALITSIQQAADTFQKAGDSANTAVHGIGESLQRVESLAQAQHAVVAAVRDATPQTLGSVNQITQLVRQTMEEASSAAAQTGQALAGTAQELKGTVHAITEGVASYSRQVATLHGQMDEKLARVIGQLDRDIAELNGSIEELREHQHLAGA